MKTTGFSRSSGPSHQPAAALKRHLIRHKLKTCFCLAGAVLITNLVPAANAQIPQLMNYQGRVAVGTPAVNFEGTGQFRFALVDGTGGVTYWSNDGTSSAGSQPATAVSILVSKGLYSVLLGDTFLPNMTAIPADVWTHPDVRLRVWFDDGVNGSQLLTPDQRIAAVGYAMMAGNVPDGTVTSAKIANGAVGSTQLADFAVAADKLRLGMEKGSSGDGALTGGGGTMTFTGTFDYPFTAAPAVTLLSPGWTLGAVTSGGFSATTSFAPITLDGPQMVGSFLSLAIIDGNPAIAYYDQSNGDLKYIRATDATGTTWSTPLTIDNSGSIVGSYPSLATVDGRPAVSYWDQIVNDLMFVRANDATGTTWGTPLRIVETGDVGTHNSLAVIDGKPAISFYNSTAGSLCYIRASDAAGTAWGSPVTIDASARVGSHASLQTVNGRPAISYFDTDNDDLKFVRASDSSGTAWGAPQAIDTADRVGINSSLAIVNGHPAVAYYDITNADLKFIRASDPDGASWATPVVIDSDLNVGRACSLAVIAGRPAISYYNLTLTDLKYVQAIDAVGNAWGAPAVIDSSGSVGAATSLEEHSGRAAIGYYDSTNGDLKFALLPADLQWQASDGSVAPLTASSAATVADGAVGNAQLAPDAVQSANIVVGAVGTTQLASGAVGNAQIAPNAVQAENIASGAVGSAQLDSSIGLWTASGTDLFRGTGKVGIGTDTPTTALDVAGTLKATNFTGNGAGLTGVPVGAGAVDSIQLVNNAVRSEKIAAGAVDNTKLANPGLTVNASYGLSGGGTVALGGSLTLENSGVIILRGGGGVTVSSANGDVTLGSTATNANIANAIVRRDTEGSFAARTISLSKNLSLSGNLSLPSTSVDLNGVVFINGIPFLHNFALSTFVGANAGNFTMYGFANTGIGETTLKHNTVGSYNTANGYQALYANTSGQYNTANGYRALYSNLSGQHNTAVGEEALNSNTTGNGNTALGAYAGRQLTTGSDNIHIGNAGQASDSATIRIGTEGTQTNTYIAGIFDSVVATRAVCVDSSGHLGTAASSRRFKEAIVDMGDQSEVLLSLRPVSFRYKPEIDPQATPQFGLIAEEVEEVAPALVLCDDKGEIYSVRYEKVNAMLLNEFLKQHRQIADLQQRLAELEKRLSPAATQP